MHPTTNSPERGPKQHDLHSLLVEDQLDPSAIISLDPATRETMTQFLKALSQEVGRPVTAPDLARAIRHFRESGGTIQLTNAGDLEALVAAIRNQQS